MDTRIRVSHDDGGRQSLRWGKELAQFLEGFTEEYNIVAHFDSIKGPEKLCLF
jgi:hypothetical protein